MLLLIKHQNTNAFPSSSWCSGASSEEGGGFSVVSKRFLTGAADQAGQPRATG